jgi:U4/U6.U5 tri-snRNP-associated protein 1
MTTSNPRIVKGGRKFSFLIHYFLRVRNRRELHASLKGSTLGDAGGDVDDTLKWVKKAKKREKELAKRRQQELESMDKVFQGDEYTERE